MARNGDDIRPADPATSCPSAQPDMEGARVFGLVTGTPEEPRIAFLKKDAVVTRAMMARLDGLDPTHVFRFAARCEESRCVHFDGARCQLARRIVDQLDPVVDALPPCLIRPTCRWHAEQGAAACHRCPQVTTMVPRAEERLSQAAMPPGEAAPNR
jgi:hypothetical protein